MIKLLNILENKNLYDGFVESELTEQYPINFSLDEFKNITSYKKKQEYAREFLGKPIGSGSARVVYRVDNNKVLKLAKNKKGIAQNEVEIYWGGDSYYYEILADVFDYDTENNYWVEMELASSVKTSDFKKNWGFDLYKIYHYVYNKLRRRIFHIEEEIVHKLDEFFPVQRLIEFLEMSDSTPGDIQKKNSWGKVIREGKESIILIDFGLTNDVYNSYYS